MNKQQILILVSSIYILALFGCFNNISLVLGIFIIIAGSILTFTKKLSYKLFIISLCFYLAGIVNYNLQMKDYDSLISYSPADATITARIVSIPTTNNSDRTKFYADVFSLTKDEDTVNNLKAKTIITIYDRKDNLSSLKIGDILKISGRLNKPSKPQNPYQFDYASYLKYRGIFTTFYANENSFEIVKRADKLPWTVLSKLNDTRSEIIKRHSANIHSPNIEILGGIIFGDDAVNPTDEIKNSFIDSGLLHILAASGMNVTLIFAIWFFITSHLKINYRFSIFSGMVIILFYTCMTGFGASILRATLMLLFILLGKLIDKDTDTLALLFFVALLMLIVSPSMLNDVGFQLSFIVTFGLLFSSKFFNWQKDNKILNTIFVSMIVPFVAQLYAAPLQMFYFNTFALYSVIANIMIVPVLSIISFLGFVSSILAACDSIAPFVCKLSSCILNPLISWIVFVATNCSSLPHSIIKINNFGFYSLITYYSVIIIFTYLMINSKLTKKTIIIPIVLLIIFVSTFIKIPDNNTEIIFFSVGNADSALIKSPDNKYFMIDTGRLPYRSLNSSAKQIILKYLNKEMINELEALILTHFDSDHAGGAGDILSEINVKHTYIIDVDEKTNISENIMSILNENKLKYTNVKNNLVVYDIPGFKITNYVNKKATDENDASIITVIETQNQNIVFMGDCTTKSLQILPENIKDKINILKIGHHGAKNTFDEETAKHTKFALISTGQNQYGHPTKEVIDILTSNSVRYLRTDNNNAVKIIIKPNTTEFYSYYPHLRKFVRTQNI